MRRCLFIVLSLILFPLSFHAFAERKMGIELETNTLKLKNDRTYNLTLFEIGHPRPVWALETDTIDGTARAHDIHDAANIEAKTFGGFDKDNIIGITNQIVAVMQVLKEWVPHAGCPPCEAVFGAKDKVWPLPPRGTAAAFKAEMERWAGANKLPIKNFHRDPEFCFYAEGMYMPQITVQLPLAQISSLFGHSMVGGIASLRDFEAYYLAHLKGPIEGVSDDLNTRGFLLFLYYVQNAAYQKDARGEARARGGENGVKYALTLMPRADLRVLFKMLVPDEQERIRAFLVPQAAEFRKYKVKHYLSMEGEPVEDAGTFEDYVNYIVSSEANPPKPKFYTHSSSMHELDEQTAAISHGLKYPVIILEFRGFKRNIPELGSIDLVRAKILEFSEEFFG
jgi:hypothetical protein